MESENKCKVCGRGYPYIIQDGYCTAHIPAEVVEARNAIIKAAWEKEEAAKKASLKEKALAFYSQGYRAYKWDGGVDVKYHNNSKGWVVVGLWEKGIAGRRFDYDGDLVHDWGLLPKMPVPMPLEVALALVEITEANETR